MTKARRKQDLARGSGGLGPLPTGPGSPPTQTEVTCSPTLIARGFTTRIHLLYVLPTDPTDQVGRKVDENRRRRNSEAPTGNPVASSKSRYKPTDASSQNRALGWCKHTGMRRHAE